MFKRKLETGESIVITLSASKLSAVEKKDRKKTKKREAYNKQKPFNWKGNWLFGWRKKRLFDRYVRSKDSFAQFISSIFFACNSLSLYTSSIDIYSEFLFLFYSRKIVVAFQ